MNQAEEREAESREARASARRDALREGLRKWGRTQRSQAEHRDPLVLASLEAGVTIEEVHQATGLGRSTIERIKKAEEEQS